MCYCYSCGNALYDWNKSDEHIIPNSLGGRLKSDKILCIDCNSEFGEGLDSYISTYINLPTLLDIDRERGTPPKVKGFTKTGANLKIDSNLTPEKDRVESKLLADGKRSVILRNEEEARKVLKKHKKKNPTLNIDEELKKIKWKDEHIDEPVYFENDILSGPDAMRAITKIAINYYCSALKDIHNISHLIPFIKGEEDAHIVYHFFQEPPIYTPANDEISHVLYLKGDREENLLYCYIELFNCHTLLIILNENYKGFNFEKTYIYDLESKNEIHTNVALTITKEQLSQMTPPGPHNSHELFFQKLATVLQKKDIEFVQTPIEK